VSAQWKALSEEERQVFHDYYNTVELPNHLQSKNSANHNGCDETEKPIEKLQSSKRKICNNNNFSSKRTKNVKNGLPNEKESEQKVRMSQMIYMIVLFLDNLIEFF
jgi:hypothetical protein